MRISAALFAFFVAQGVATATWAIDRERSLHQMHHTSWTPREGAPTYVQEMAQTDDGFLWFGTNSGLLRFDGVQFERYVPASGEALPSASIRTLRALPGNGLIIGWFFGGATLLRDGRAVRYGVKEGYPTGSTYEFAIDGDGRLWAATADALARFDGERWHQVGADWNFDAPRAIALFVDRAGTLGAFTDKTLLTLPKGATSFRPTGGTLTTKSPIVQSPDGTYFLWEERGIRSIASLEQYDRVNRPWLVKGIPYDSPKIRIDRDGSLWFSSNLRGVGRIAYPDRKDPGVEYFSMGDGLSAATTRVVFEDREGSVWVTTDGGVDRFRAATFVPPTGKLLASIPAMAATSEGVLRFAEFGHDLHELTRQGVVRDVAPAYLTCAYTDPAGITWYGSRASERGKAELLRHAAGRLERIAVPDDVGPLEDVQAIAMDSASSLWISVVGRGVYRRVGDEWVKPPEFGPVGKTTPIVITANASGEVWLGYVGDRVIRWKDSAIRIFRNADGIAVGNVLAIHKKGSHVWIGGQRGLAVFESDRILAMTVAEPDVMRGINGIVETDEGDLWLHGSAGAIRIKAAEVRRGIDEPGHRMDFRLFDHEDGLSGTPTEIRPLPTLVAGTDGRLWFGTNRGAFALDPKRIPVSSAPPVIIKAAIAGNTRHASPAHVDFPALTTAVQIDYTATNLATPLRTRFRYKLTGIDPDWQDAGGRRQAFYTNLGPGSYRFQVIAANEDGLWNTTGAGFDFAIAPAWYQTRWFAALCVLAALALVVLVFNLRIRQVRAQIQGRLEERLMERERIARELHDTLLQSTQGLILQVQSAATELPPDTPSRKRLEVALHHANDVVAEGRDRVLDLRAAEEQGDLRAILRDAANEAGFASDVEVRIDVTGEPRPVHPMVLAEIRRIASEALFNAARHARAKSVEVTAAFSPRELRIRIRDDGVGIDDSMLASGEKAGHFGLVGMRERAGRIGGKLSIESRPGSGCDVTLELPSQKARRGVHQV